MSALATRTAIVRDGPRSGPAPDGGPRAAPPAGGPPDAERRPGLRLAAFAALGAWGAVHWAGLVADPPVARALFAVAAATAGAAALACVPRLRLAPGAAAAVAALVALMTLAAALAAGGLAPRMLLPAGWGELADGLDRGLSGIRGVSWPYDGPDPWVRRSILLGAPFLLGLAAVAGFWPARRAASRLRALALVLLVALYATAVTEHDPGKPLARGIVLLALVAAWLWLPRLSPREALRGGVVVATAGLCALPLAAELDADRPWWDYRSWNWFGGGKRVTFDWEHSYGPLDWPRDGTTLLQVRSDRPHYWKAEALDRFDGLRWLRSGETPPAAALDELPDRVTPAGRRWRYFELNPRWAERIRFTVRALRTNFVVGAGTTYSVSGAGATAGTADGTTIKLDEPLERGDSYMVSSYAPDPSARQMRAAPPGYPATVNRYTEIFVPRRGQARGQPRRPPVSVPPGEPSAMSRRARERLLASPYARAYRLASSLAAGAGNAYDVVKRVENHLQRRYEYSEDPPSRRYPLAAFLFRDRIGYCQQFSGAMALMLRMLGIPARVVSGFAPGSYNRETREYRVRDLDAHSWVEVYFTGIGWVPFDPTPAAAPAGSQSGGLGATSAARGDAGEVSAGRGGGSRRPERSGARARGSPERAGGGLRLWAVPALLGLVALAGGGLWGGRRVRSRGAGSDAHVAELERALPRLGWRVPGGTTLLALERRLARSAGPAAASYVRRLRAHRYDPRAPDAPGLRARSSLRRELTAGRGLRARLRGLVAIPPGGPGA